MKIILKRFEQWFEVEIDLNCGEIEWSISMIIYMHNMNMDRAINWLTD